MSVTLPGGSVASVVYVSRRMRAWGAGASLIGFSLLATGALSTFALALLAAVGSALAGDVTRIGWAAVQLAAVLGLTVAVGLLRRPTLLRRPVQVGMRVVHRLGRGGGGQFAVDGMLLDFDTIRPSAGVWTRGLGFALANWAGDFACLLAACHALRARPGLSAAILAYAAGMAAASAMPFVPAGLGTVDAALVLALRHSGVPVGVATAADLVYRLISLGLVAGAGWLIIAARHRRGPCGSVQGHSAKCATR